MKNKGFTILETLVAIAVVMLAIIGTASAVSSGLSSYTSSKDQIVAFYLAQEGIEQIRNMRDENRLVGAPYTWLTGISANSGDPCWFGRACIVSPLESSVATSCPAPGSCPVLRQHPTLGYFGYNGSLTPTKFRREIVLTQISADEAALTVTVYWTKGLTTRQFKAREHIFNW